MSGPDRAIRRPYPAARENVMENGIDRELQKLPGVGPRIARDLRELGYRSIVELAKENPQAMYERLCAQKGVHVDRCMLYVFRCAVYFASTPDPSPERLKWWNWKD